MALARWLFAREAPLRSELYSSDQMDQHGSALAAEHRASAAPRRWRQRDPLLARLNDNEGVLILAGDMLKAAVTASHRIAPAGEWLLDNFHLIEEQVRTARRHLPRAYSRELPRLLSGPSAGLPRVYDIALEAISHGDGRVDLASLQRFVAAYQGVTVLKLGELWAIPIMLRLALIENLRRVGARIAAGTSERDLADGWADRMVEIAASDAKSLILVTADMARSDPPMVSSFVAELARRLQGQGAALALPLTWVEQRLAESGLTIEQLVQAETQEQAADQVSMSNSIGSLRLLGATDWRDFVEGVSAVEQALRADAVYPTMDFATRDRYRHVVEKLAKASRRPEADVARMALEMARAAKPRSDGDLRASHLGYYLVDRGLPQLELAALARVPVLWKLRALARQFSLPLYLGAVGHLTALLTAAVLAIACGTGAGGLELAWLAALSLLATSQLALALVNGVAMSLAAPRLLPRLDFSGGIPPQCRTLAVVPAMLASAQHIDELAEDLEVRFLANRDAMLQFGLLTDFEDAHAQALPADAALALRARERIEGLNLKYGANCFFLFHRPRRWNAGEGCWMGYERKRGKLAELNALLRGGDGAGFSIVAGNTAGLAGVKYVITLDTDTQLARDSARQLVGAMAHPLNRPRRDPARRSVAEGYGILQPRMAVSLSATGQSRYARLCGSEPGIDPYTRTVSDLYQDLFGEGSFIGKGIYDVDAFEYALNGRFPENRILSHDLLEGCYARSGLLSDVQMYEAYPSRYRADVSRRHRWIRGDWQIAPWLLRRVPGSERNPLSALSQWKIFDNLRRSLVPAALVLLACAGWIVTVLAVVMAPSLLAALLAVVRKPADVPFGRHLSAAARSAGSHLAQAGFALACLPYEAYYSLDALLRTSARLLVTRTGLLQWTPSRRPDAQGGRRAPGELVDSLRAMWIGPAAAGAATLWLLSSDPHALGIAAPVFLLWLLCPVIAWWVSRPAIRRPPRLTRGQREFLLGASRRTWAFFETFVGTEDHWLPPDNFQEQPTPLVAHRTSPTNMGLALLANLCAHDFGYLTAAQLVERTSKALGTMQGLERHEGHFYNWYDTRTLQPLPPLYVSSVDSGNLAAHLLTLRPGLLALADASLLPPRLMDGLRDTARLVADAALQADADSARGSKAALERLGARAEQIAGAAQPDSEESGWALAFARQCRAALDELAFFSVDYPEGGRLPTVRELAASPGEIGQRARERIGLLGRLAQQCAGLAQMEQGFLIDKGRGLLAIGYNVAERRRDPGCYDLLASEARCASFVAIAQGELPQESWFALGRLLATGPGEPTLLSWSGSMFEYLMPLLVMPSYEGTLLERTCRAAVRRQIAHGRASGVPWGMSESGYNAVDAASNYQYHAFGVPGLGLKRGLSEDLVIAPYASALALMVAPEAACLNLQRLAAEGLAGKFGFYEAIDYTPSRVPRGQSSAVVRSFMAHHQGMSLLSLGALLLGPRMQERFASEPLFQATLLLLQERIPKPAALYLDSAGRFDVRASAVGPQMPVRVLDTPHTPAPEVQLLSNGRYHVMVTNAGGGYSRWKDLAVTRWREDATRDHWGSFCYLRDPASGAFWSGAHQPSLRHTEGYEAIFSEARAEFRRRDLDYDAHTEIVVSSEDDIELRRLRVVNLAPTRRQLEVTSYAEVVLAPAPADALHPAFSNLFVQTEILREQQAILCTRRPRSAAEAVPWMFHQVTVHGAHVAATSFETDRARFIGRGNTPALPLAMLQAAPLSGGEGSVLDPIVAVRHLVVLEPDQSVTIDMVSGVAETREACLALSGKYRDRHLADRVFDLAWTHSRVTLRQINATESDAQLYGRLASSVLYAHAAQRAEVGILMKNRRAQSGLWGYAISGDLPVVLLRIGDAANIDLVRQMVQAHAYWRLKGLAVDLVIWNEDHAGYRQPLQEQILGLIAAGIEANVVDRPGGIFVRRAEQISEEDRVLFQSVARAVISDRRGTLAEQIGPRAAPKRRRAARGAARDASPARIEDAPPALAAPRADLLFYNGAGGFTPDGREYVIASGAGHATPAPWCNVLANPRFGSVVTESGPAYTWSENAHEFRLTPWSNDALSDAGGEAFYVRDEKSGRFWSATPLPCAGATPYTTRHGFGYSIFEHAEDGIESELCVYVDLEVAVKFSVLKLRNASGRPRRISVTGYVEWVLGDLRPKSAMHVLTEIDPASGALHARNAFNSDFPARTAFFHVDDPARAVSGDRTEFIGRNGTLADPAAMHSARLSNSVGAALDPCGALQSVFDLAEGKEHKVVFTLGMASTGQAMPGARGALEKVRRYWERTLGVVQVETPDPSFDVLANGWLLYQTLACRLWARSGLYQSGGAFGFRDQLQDVVALLHAEPALSREHLLLCAGRQYREGDVQHWWHPPSGRGVRTHCSDDYLWLPWATCRYVASSGDATVLDETAPFLEGRPVNPADDSYYDLPTRSGDSARLYEHCVLAIENGLHFGVHGLPLMGSGDWNDGMNEVGARGFGESVWLGFFLFDVLRQFAPLSRARGDVAFAKRCEDEAAQLRVKLEEHGWDGEWYRRAYFDDGTPLGSAAGTECRIDSIAQSWSVLSGAAWPSRSRQAMESLDRHLVRRDAGIVQLLDPPFDGSKPNPGYIEGYVPGVRENGGQYTHAAIWAAMAFAELGDRRRAGELFALINPVNRTKSAAGLATYKVEPYVMAADVYARAPHVGRGGWTWYTGSAGWMYRLAIESILGLRREGSTLRFEPSLPEGWPGFKLRYRFGETVYRIEVQVETAAPGLAVDGVEREDGAIALLDDRREHQVELRL